MPRLLGLFALMTVVFAGPDARAQVAAEDILRSLQPAAQTRGITALPARRIEVEPGHEAEALDHNKDLPRIDLAVEFDYDSDRPTPAGERQLVQLAEALRHPAMSGFRFMLAGHTDARGTDNYNRRLSSRRAIAVARYLAEVAQIDPARLTTAGFGESRLIANIGPEDPRNRRVEVVNLLN